MGTRWRRARDALGLRVCVSPPLNPDDGDAKTNTQLKQLLTKISAITASTPPGSPSRFHLIRSSIRSSRSNCAICLESMRPGQGHALFTAECSHTFHFPCIASNLQHRNLVCPICRAQWKEVPCEAPISKPRGKNNGTPQRGSGLFGQRQADVIGSIQQRVSHVAQERRLDPVLPILDRSVADIRAASQTSLGEPVVFDDDEPLVGELPRPRFESTSNTHDSAGPFSGASEESDRTSDLDRINAEPDVCRALQVTICAEATAVASWEQLPTFTVLIHVRSPVARKQHHWHKREKMNMDQSAQIAASTDLNILDTENLLDPSCRAPLDLVTVLDVSGSMSGTKLALLKRAMGFVIRSLSPADRLSVVAFASAAYRVMPLRRMVYEGQQAALQAVNALACTGGSNIVEGLRKGAKVLRDRRQQNPVASVMLLSDGKGSYTINNNRGSEQRRHRHLSFPHRHLFFPPRHVRGRYPSARSHDTRYGHVQIPVHAFGFGRDNDARTMHSISEESEGTFSFVQAEGLVQEAIAQCIGVVLSVVVQDLQVFVCTGTEGVELKSIDAGAYESRIVDVGSKGVIKLGDLYAEEDRYILVDLYLPPCVESETKIVRAHCTYKDPVTQQPVKTAEQELIISRPDHVVREKIDANECFPAQWTGGVS